jgi:sugar lactone lactonase YvrE
MKLTARICAGVVGGALALIALAPGAAHARYEHVGQWAVPEAAGGLAVGSGGVYVSRESGAFDEQAVRRYSLDGKLLTTWGEPGSAPRALVDPGALATSPDGRVHVVDGFGRLVTYAADGTFVGERSLTAPCGDELLIRGLDIDPAGDVYVTFYDNCNLVAGDTRYGVIRAGADLAVTAVWGDTGAADGQFNRPAGLASDGRGTVYVADANNYRIQKFTSMGGFTAKWGQLGGGPGQFNGLGDVAISPAGEVFATDRNNERIQRFAADGRFLEELRIPGDVTYRGLVAELEFDAQGRLYVLSTGHGTEDEVNVFAPRGGGAAAIPKQTLRYRRGGIKVTVTCGGAARCAGKLVIRKGNRKLGARAYRVASGKRKRIRVAVKGKTERRVARRTTRVTVTLKPKGGERSKRTLVLRR